MVDIHCTQLPPRSAEFVIPSFNKFVKQHKRNCKCRLTWEIECITKNKKRYEKVFWDEDDEIPKKLTDKMVEKAENFLGYKLPESYIELLKTRNGGCSINTCFPTKEKTSWADDHVAIETICGIGVEDGIDDNEYGSRYMIKEWGYPEIGVVICTCPSGGHDTIMLDYSDCRKDSETKVVHIDTETENGEPKVTFLAKDFETFVRGLISDDEFDD